MGATLGPNRYGKSGVRVASVVRDVERHAFAEREVEVRLEGDFDAVHLEGDNATVLPTDTMRGAVYALAKEHPDEAPEAFGLRYTAYLLDASPAASRAEAWIVDRPWDRVEIDGAPHPHTFTRGAFAWTAHVLRDRSSATVGAGIEDLFILKTTGSAFGGFLRDRYTTLAETEDRILATRLEARWRYGTPELDFRAERERVKDAIVRAFAAHHESRSMQHTLWAMGRAVVDGIASVEEISFSLPNLHHIEVDLSPYGMTNDHQVFLVTDAPSGRIEGTVRRSDAS